MKKTTMLKDNMILSGLSTGKVNDVRLALMTSVIQDNYNNSINDYSLMVQKIKEYFNVDVTTGRLHVFYVTKEEENIKRSEVIYINY